MFFNREVTFDSSESVDMKYDKPDTSVFSLLNACDDGEMLVSVAEEEVSQEDEWTVDALLDTVDWEVLCSPWLLENLSMAKMRELFTSLDEADDLSAVAETLVGEYGSDIQDVIDEYINNFKPSFANKSIRL
jgi:hypothetical protein